MDNKDEVLFKIIEKLDIIKEDKKAEQQAERLNAEASLPCCREELNSLIQQYAKLINNKGGAL